MDNTTTRIRCTDERGTVLATLGATPQGTPYLSVSRRLATKRFGAGAQLPQVPGFGVWCWTRDSDDVRAFKQ